MKSLQGKLLIATPQQLDSSFVRTVILVVQHTEQGAFGVVVNRPASAIFRVLWQRAAKQGCGGTWQLHLGGPVTGPLMALHGDASLGEIKVLPNVFFAAKEDHVAGAMRQFLYPCKVFLGYAGWGPKQLEHELDKGFWLAAPGTSTRVFSGEENLWEEMIKEVRISLLHTVFNIRHIPDDPLMN